VNQRIIKDDGGLPHFTLASQSIATSVALLRGLPEPVTTEDHWAQHEIHTLLKHVALQQAESLMSRRRELNASQHAPSRRHYRKRVMVPIHERVGTIRDARNTHRHGREDEREGPARGYHPRCGGRYDSAED
jgi:hypothetical protein